MKINHYPLVLVIYILIVSSCTHNKLKELIIHKTIYTYSDHNCDSLTLISEHYYFNKDSVITKYFNYKDGYFYLAEHNKKNHILNKKYYTTDNIFLYRSISQLNNDGLKTKIDFYDTSNNISYSINTFYKENSSIINKEQNIFSNGVIQETIYEYDKYNNILNVFKVSNQDTISKEIHKRMYNEFGRIVTDTIYFPESRKIVKYEYDNELLYYQIEKFEKKSDTCLCYTPISNAYWKKYYKYNKKGKVIETRNIKMYDNSKVFRLDSKMQIKYNKRNLVNHKTLYNSKNQKVYSIDIEYKY